MDLDNYQLTNGEDDDVGACPVDSEYDGKKSQTRWSNALGEIGWCLR